MVRSGSDHLIRALILWQVTASSSGRQTFNVVSFATGGEARVLFPHHLEGRSEENAELQSHEQSTHNASSGVRDLSHDTPGTRNNGFIGVAEKCEQK